MHVFITEKWNEYLTSFPHNITDIYFTEEYVRLYETEKERALCVICEDGDNITLMPFLRRNIDVFFDFETAYGYGGPISNTDSEDWIHSSLNAIREHFVSQNYLCGFMRFHPLIKNAGMCKDEINIIYDRKTISIDLRPSVEDIWANQITSKNRNMIRKAEKNGLSYRAEYDYSSISDFKHLYRTTMERLNAEEFYFFDEKYFEKYINDLSNHGFLGIVTLNGKTVGAALFMTYGEYGHYHLAGSDREYSSLGINNFMLWNTISELKKCGVTTFHLGGGTTSESHDPLFKFKRSFSNIENDFHIGKWIFNENAYKEVCHRWENDNPDLKEIFGNRLLKYRYTKDDI